MRQQPQSHNEVVSYRIKGCFHCIPDCCSPCELKKSRVSRWHRWWDLAPKWRLSHLETLLVCKFLAEKALPFDGWKAVTTSWSSSHTQCSGRAFPQCDPSCGTLTQMNPWRLFHTPSSGRASLYYSIWKCQLKLAYDTTETQNVGWKNNVGVITKVQPVYC